MDTGSREVGLKIITDLLGTNIQQIEKPTSQYVAEVKCGVGEKETIIARHLLRRGNVVPRH